MDHIHSCHKALCSGNTEGRRWRRVPEHCWVVHGKMLDTTASPISGRMALSRDMFLVRLCLSPRQHVNWSVTYQQGSVSNEDMEPRPWFSHWGRLHVWSHPEHSAMLRAYGGVARTDRIVQDWVGQGWWRGILQGHWSPQRSCLIPNA